MPVMNPSYLTATTAENDARWMGFDNAVTPPRRQHFRRGERPGAIPEYWYRPFQDTFYTYLNGKPKTQISEMVNQLTHAAKTIYSAG